MVFRSVGVLVYQMVLDQLPPPLTEECIEVAPVPDFEHADCLIQKLLRQQPKERITALEALCEPFVCAMARGAVGIPNSQSQARLTVLRQEISRLHDSAGWQRQDRWQSVEVDRVAVSGTDGGSHVSVEGVLRVFAALTPSDLTKRLDVTFVGQPGEVGQDYGGLTANMYREFWGGVLSNQCALGLFEGSNSMLPAAGSSCEHHKTIGKLIMKCLYDQQPLPRALAPSLFKSLLEVLPGVEDLHWFDREQAQMLRRMVVSPGGSEGWDFTFDDAGGDPDVKLTEANKSEFWFRKVQHELCGKRRVHYFGPCHLMFGGIAAGQRNWQLCERVLLRHRKRLVWITTWRCCLMRCSNTSE